MVVFFKILCKFFNFRKFFGQNGGLKQNRRRIFTDFQFFTVGNHSAFIPGIWRNADHFVVLFVADYDNFVPRLRPFGGYILIAFDNGTSGVKNHNASAFQILFRFFCHTVSADKRNISLFQTLPVLFQKANRSLSIQIIGDVFIVNERAQSIDFSVFFGKRNRHIHGVFHTSAKSCVRSQFNFQFSPLKTTTPELSRVVFGLIFSSFCLFYGFRHTRCKDGEFRPFFVW